MKENLNDLTFLVLVRLDSIERLENIIAITDSLCRYFNTNVYVLEIDRYNKNLLKPLLNRKIFYQFIEDVDPVLYKTKYFNMMISTIETKFVAVWDADVVVDRDSVVQSMSYLKDDEFDIVYPYNGICLEVPTIIRTYYLKKRNIRFLYSHKNKMSFLHDRLLVGGAVLMNKEKFVKAGMENEKYYGWGNDDFDRYYRLKTLGYRIHRINTYLFHLSHPRCFNSSYGHNCSSSISKKELFKTESSSREEIINDLKNI